MQSFGKSIPLLFEESMLLHRSELPSCHDVFCCLSVVSCNLWVVGVL